MILMMMMMIIIIIIIIIFIPGLLKTGLEKNINSFSTSWQFQTKKLIQRPTKSLYLTPGSKLMVPRSIPTSPNLKWRRLDGNSVYIHFYTNPSQVN